MHALLEGFAQDTLIENQNRRHKTDKIIARTLIFSKNQKTTRQTFTRKTWPKNRTKIYPNLYRRNHAYFENLIWPNKIFFQRSRASFRNPVKRTTNTAEEKKLRQTDLTKNYAE